METEDNNLKLAFYFNICLKFKVKFKEKIMEENLQNQETVPIQPQISESGGKKWAKITLFIFVGLILLAGTFYAGVKYSENKGRQRLANFPTPTVRPSPFPSPETPTPTPTILEETSPIADWQEYKNDKYGFSIKYPQNWVVREYDSKSMKGVNMHGIGFGTVESIPGGMIWGVSVYDIVGDTNEQIKDVIKEIGSQFSDRQEKRESITMKGRPATKVTVTTGQYKDWFSETVVFEGKNKIFSIGNGAVKNNRFEDFYQSFTYIQ